MNPLPPLSVAVITFNEERNLARCLASVGGLAAELVVIDSGFTDQTGEIARQCGAVFERNQWPGYVAQKNVALRRSTQPWVLSLDADEALSPELADSIRQLFAAGEPAASGYLVNRRTWYLGDWLWHAWYPEWRLRLVRREQAEWHGLDPHDKLAVAGPSERLTGDLLHYPYRNLRDHFNRTIQHAQTMAESYAREGRRFRWHRLLFSPGLIFLKFALLKGGWRDGWRGWLVAGLKAVNVFAKYAFLLERERNAGSR